jgi:hypothetical protein
MFFADCKSYSLASVADVDEDQLPWLARRPTSALGPGRAAQSPLASAKGIDGDDSDMDEDDASQLDDTFQFKRFGVE